MKEVPFLSKMVYKGLGFGTRGRSPRIILLCWVAPPPRHQLSFRVPSEKKTERLKHFWIQSQIPSNLTFSIFFPLEEKSSLSPLSCDVVVVGGGISGLYMAETLMRRKKEHDVCLFEKDSRFGGKNYDVAFKRAQNVSLSKKLHFPWTW